MTTPATDSWSATESDPQRTAILAAADRILVGKPTTSTGRFSVVQLAIEAGVKYWIVAQKHTDLRNHFQHLAAQAKTAEPIAGGPVPTPSALSAQEKLAKRCAELEELIATYAQVINELSTENAALRESAADRRATITPFRKLRNE